VGLFTGRAERRDFGVAGQTIPTNGMQGNGPSSLVSVTTESAMTLSTVWACVDLRASLISTLPLEVFRKRGEVKELVPTPKVLRSPGGSRCDIEEWLYSGQVALDLRGNNYGFITSFDLGGYPTQIELLHPDMVSAGYEDATVDGVRRLELVYRIQGQKVDADRIWHEKAHTFPGVPVGLSVIAYAARTFGIELAAERFGHEWFRDGAHPSSVLMSDKTIDDKDARTIKQRIMSVFSGGNREPLVLGAGLKYEAIQVNPNESQFLDTMRFSTEQICRFFATDPELVGGSSGSGSGSITYANREQRALDYLTLKFGPTVMVRRERALSKLTPAPQFVKFDADELLRTDLKTRYEAHNMAIAGKWRTPDETRHLEDEAPLTDEQKAELELVPLTVTPSGQAKAKPPAPAPAPAVDDAAA